MTDHPAIVTTRAALRALLEHMDDHDLPLPYSIDSYMATGQQELKITVPGWDLDAWADTLDLTADTYEPQGATPETHRYVRRRIYGTLRIPEQRAREYAIPVQVTGVCSPGATRLLAALAEHERDTEDPR